MAACSLLPHCSWRCDEAQAQGACLGARRGRPACLACNLEARSSSILQIHLPSLLLLLTLLDDCSYAAVLSSDRMILLQGGTAACLMSTPVSMSHTITCMSDCGIESAAYGYNCPCHQDVSSILTLWSITCSCAQSQLVQILFHAALRMLGLEDRGVLYAHSELRPAQPDEDWNDCAAGRCAADMEYSVGFTRDGVVTGLDVAVYMENGIVMDSGFVDFIAWQGCADQVITCRPPLPIFHRFPCWE